MNSAEKKKKIKKMNENGSIYTDPRYRRWRSKVFKRDGYGCQYPGCKYPMGTINAHHIQMKWYFPEFIFHIKNGITLCAYHHTFIHKNKMEQDLLELFLAIAAENTSKKRIIRKKRVKRPKKDKPKKQTKSPKKTKKKVTKTSLLKKIVKKTRKKK